MANIDNIISKLEEETNKTCNDIIAEAKQKAEKILSESFEKASNTAKTNEDRATREKNEKIEQIIESSKLKARDIELIAKENIVNQAIELLLNKLSNLSDSEFINYFKTNTKNIKELSSYEIIVPSKYREAFKSLDVNLSEETTDDGFILKKDSVLFNNSFKSLIDENIEDFENEIRKNLF